MIIRTLLIICFLSSIVFSNNKLLDSIVQSTMSGHDGVCVFMDCKSGSMIISDSVMAKTRYTPCSTFKIWNSLIGIECKVVKSSDEFFYKWDSIPRFLPAWNKDLNFKDAFKVSCVPAFQDLARKIGAENIKRWIDTISYGDKDISSGIDDFWLPRDGKKSIKISPVEQVQLIRKLINGDLPFSKLSRDILQEVMIIEKTTKGVYYGKTGSGMYPINNNNQNIGWFTGYVTNITGTYSFACLLKGKNVSGKDSKAIIESILKKSQLM